MDETGAWVAKSAIAELIVRYAALADAADWEALAALYAEDGRMSRPTAPEDFVCGRGAILDSLRARPPRIVRHIVANVLVSLQDDVNATATSQILLYTGTSDGSGPPVLSIAAPLVGTYRDRLVRASGAWRFLERRGSVDLRAAP